MVPAMRTDAYSISKLAGANRRKAIVNAGNACDFIRDHLGPAFRCFGLQTRICCYDHNYNVKTRGDDPGIPYPRMILSDARAAQSISGVAMHDIYHAGQIQLLKKLSRR